MKKLKRILSLGAAVAMLMSCTLTANSEVLKQNSVSTITTTEDLKSSSTVYVGEVVVDGEETTVIYTRAEMKVKTNTVTTVTAKETLKKESSVYVGEVYVKDGDSTEKQLTYVYSPDLTNSQSVLDNLRNALGTEEAKALMPETTEGGANGLKLSTSHAEEMDDDWKDAKKVAEKYFEGTVSGDQSTDLYDHNEATKAYVDSEWAEAQENIVNPVDPQKGIVSHIGSKSVDVVTYSNEGGQVVKTVNTIVTYDCDRTKIYYTTAIVEAPAAEHSVTLKDAETDETLCTCVVPNGSSLRAYFNEDINRMKPLYTYDEQSGKYYAPKTLSEDRAGTEPFSMASAVESDMTVYVGLTECTGEVDITLEAPVCGTNVTSTSRSFADEPEQTNAPVVSFADPNCESVAAYWTENLLVDPENGYYRIWSGEIVGGETYNALIVTFAGIESGKLLSMFPKVTVNGEAIPEAQVVWEEGIVFITADIEAVHDLTKTEAKKPTITETGNIEYWSCSGCGKLFSDDAAKNEISPDDVILEKLVDTRKKGDLNNNGKIDASDLLQIKSHIKKVKPLEGEDFKIADVDDNGAINAADLLKMKAHMKGVSYLW